MAFHLFSSTLENTIPSYRFHYSVYIGLAVSTPFNSYYGSIGTFIYAPLTDYLLSEYGWRGAILILAGNLLNMCVCGALMREPDGWGDSTCGDSEVDLNFDMSAVLDEVESPLCHSLMSLPSYIKAKEKVRSHSLQS